MLRPTAATVIFGALVFVGFALLVSVFLPLSGPAWDATGAGGLHYYYLSEFF